MKRKFRVAPILTGLFLTAGALSGCVTDMAGYSGVDSEGKRDFLNYAAAESPVLLEVQRAPFAGGDAATASVAARDVSGKVLGSPAAFTADASKAKHPDYRVVIYMNSFPAGKPGVLCGDGEVAKNEQPGKLRLDAAFCAGKEALSTAWAESTVPVNLHDPRFADMLRRVVNDLFPQQRDRGQGEGEFILGKLNATHPNAG